jgi:hypothetical protein
MDCDAKAFVARGAGAYVSDSVAFQARRAGALNVRD